MEQLFFYTVITLLGTGLAVWLVFSVLLAGMAVRALARAVRWVAGICRAAAARVRVGGAR